MLTASLGKSPGTAAIWLLVAIMALWSTRSEYLSPNGFQDNFHRQHHHHGYSALRTGIVVDAHSYSYLPSAQYPLAFAPPTAIDTTTDDTRALVESLFRMGTLDNFGISFTAALSDSLGWNVPGSSPIAGTYASNQLYIDKVLTPIRAYRRGWRVGHGELEGRRGYWEVSHLTTMNGSRWFSGYRKLIL